MSHRTVPGSSYPRSRLPIGWARVRGDSMRPLLAPGDRLLVRYGAHVREGDLVVARFPDGTVAVKRATERRTTRDGRPAWWLLSDAPEVGVDSRHRGPVPDADVVAVVLARAWPRPARLRRRASPRRWGSGARH